MFEKLKPSVETPRDREDPRRDLYETLGPDARQRLEHADAATIREIERPFAAQIMRAHVAPAADGRTVITLSPNSPDQALLLPQANRKAWEQWSDENDPAWERNMAASDLFGAIQKNRSQIGQEFVLENIRVGLGTIYQSSEAEGPPKLIIRVNNDHKNNIYAGHGNPYSSLLKILRRGRGPLVYRNASVEELIPMALHEDSGELQEMYPEKFFYQGNYARYKQKLLKIEGKDPNSEQATHTRRVTFDPVRYDTGIDLKFDLSSLGDTSQRHFLRDVSPVLTPQGTLEIQSVLRIPTPETLLDPEFGSQAIVIDTQKLAEWWYARSEGKQRPFEFDSVIDGATGNQISDQAVLEGFRDSFQASPPLEAIIRSIFHHYDKVLN